MKLITKQIERKLLEYPIYSQDGKGMDTKVIVKFFGGSNYTWLVTEAEQEGDDWRMYGYMTLNGHDWEWGYFMFSSISKLKFKPFRLPLERDLHTNGMTVKELSR